MHTLGKWTKLPSLDRTRSNVRSSKHGCHRRYSYSASLPSIDPMSSVALVLADPQPLIVYRTLIWGEDDKTKQHRSRSQERASKTTTYCWVQLQLYYCNEAIAIDRYLFSRGDLKQIACCMGLLSDIRRHMISVHIFVVFAIRFIRSIIYITHLQRT